MLPDRLLDALARHPGDEGTLGVLADFLLEQPAPLDALWGLAHRGDLHRAQRDHARLAELVLGELARQLPPPLLQRRFLPDGQEIWRAAPWETAEASRALSLADRGLRSVGIAGWSAFVELLSRPESAFIERIWPLRLEDVEDTPLPARLSGLERLTHLALVGPAEDTPLHTLAQRLLSLPLPLAVLRLETAVPPPEPEALWRDHPTLQRLEWLGGASGRVEILQATLPPLLRPRSLATPADPPAREQEIAHEASAHEASAHGDRRRWAAATACGPCRSANEDTFAVHPSGVWTVVDGMGGQGTGASAAALIAQALREPGPARPRFAEAYAELQLRGWAAGGAAVRLSLEGTTLQIAWAGDVRAYLVREGRVARLTEDHTLVQQMVERGLLQPWEARVHPHSNIITRGLWVGEGAEPEERPLALERGDLVLLVSDGVWKALDDLVMNAIVLESASLLDAVVALVSEACRCLGTDNATALLVAPAP